MANYCLIVWVETCTMKMASIRVTHWLEKMLTLDYHKGPSLGNFLMVDGHFKSVSLCVKVL